MEGYLFPVAGPVAGIRDLFEVYFGGVGVPMNGWSDAERARLRALVESITYWTRDEWHPLRLDETRLREGNEAWVPVRTPAGPGVLVWANSD